MEKDIVIIGAGITGMTCAYELHRKGKNIQVLECQNRIGGQVISRLKAVLILVW